jgi:hypothetical protein
MNSGKLEFNSLHNKDTCFSKIGVSKIVKDKSIKTLTTYTGKKALVKNDKNLIRLTYLVWFRHEIDSQLRIHQFHPSLHGLVDLAIAFLGNTGHITRCQHGT